MHYEIWTVCVCTQDTFKLNKLKPLQPSCNWEINIVATWESNQIWVPCKPDYKIVTDKSELYYIFCYLMCIMLCFIVFVYRNKYIWFCFIIGINYLFITTPAVIPCLPKYSIAKSSDFHTESGARC